MMMVDVMMMKKITESNAHLCPSSCCYQQMGLQRAIREWFIPCCRMRILTIPHNRLTRLSWCCRQRETCEKSLRRVSTRCWNYEEPEEAAMPPSMCRTLLSRLASFQKLMKYQTTKAEGSVVERLPFIDAVLPSIHNIEKKRIYSHVPSKMSTPQ